MWISREEYEGMAPAFALLVSPVCLVLGLYTLVNGFDYFFKRRFGRAWGLMIGGLILAHIAVIGPIWFAMLS